MTEESVDNGMECTNRLSALYSSAKFSDITLLVGNQKFSTHKLLLASASDVFEYVWSISSSAYMFVVNY